MLSGKFLKSGRELLAGADVVIERLEPGRGDFGFRHEGRRLLVRWDGLMLQNATSKESYFLGG